MAKYNKFMQQKNHIPLKQKFIHTSTTTFCWNHRFPIHIRFPTT